MNKMKVLVMHVNPYNIKQDDGSVTSGMTVTYFFFGENGEALTKKENFEGQLGYARAKSSLDIDLRNRFPVAPAIYDGEFEMTIGSDGKPVMKLVNAKYVCDVCISALDKSAK